APDARREGGEWLACHRTRDNPTGGHPTTASDRPRLPRRRRAPLRTPLPLSARKRLLLLLRCAAKALADAAHLAMLAPLKKTSCTHTRRRSAPRAGRSTTIRTAESFPASKL